MDKILPNPELIQRIDELYETENTTSNSQLVTEPELIRYLDGLQQAQLDRLEQIHIDSIPQQQSEFNKRTQSSKYEAIPLSVETYRGVLKKHDIRDKVIERVLKCIINNAGNDINIFNRMFQNTANSAIQVNPESTQASKDTVTINDVSPYVLSTHDKLVIRLYRKYGIYDIMMYGRSKDKFSFLIFPMKGQMMEMSIPIRQHTPSEVKSLSTTKINIRHVVGILIASIIKNTQ